MANMEGRATKLDTVYSVRRKETHRICGCAREARAKLEEHVKPLWTLTAYSVTHSALSQESHECFNHQGTLDVVPVSSPCPSPTR